MDQVETFVVDLLAALEVTLEVDLLGLASDRTKASMSPWQLHLKVGEGIARLR